MKQLTMKACPFCGAQGKADVGTWNIPGTAQWRGMVSCRQCGARGPAQQTKDTVIDAGRAAVRGWNKRTASGPTLPVRH